MIKRIPCRSDFTSASMALSGGYYVVSHEGQESPDKSDRAHVILTIFLPAVHTSDGEPLLDPCLAFRERVKVCSEDLGRYWGAPVDFCDETIFFYRTYSAEYYGDDVSELFSTASFYADEQLSILEAALVRRLIAHNRSLE